MTHPNNRIKKAASALALIGMLAVEPAARAQWVVTDPGATLQLIIQQLTQLDVLAAQNKQLLQQLVNYKLQLQNLQQLSGSTRSDVQQQLARQLLNNVQDFGRSQLNKTATQNPNAGTYYTNAEDIVTTNIGAVPRTTAATDADLSSLGLETGTSTTIGQSTFVDRQQYERVMDDMRQVAITTQNSSDRATQANNVAAQMRDLKDNNTVGAIQLLAAQNSLTYAQNEDLIKTQSAALKNQQEQQLRVLVENEQARQREIDRLKRSRAEAIPTTVDMKP